MLLKIISSKMVPAKSLLLKTTSSKLEDFILELSIFEFKKLTNFKSEFSILILSICEKEKSISDMVVFEIFV